MQDRDAFQEIAALAIGAFHRQPERLLLYSEVEDGVWSADLFGEFSDVSKIRFRFGSNQLGQRVYEFWESGDEMVSARSWATLKMLIEGSQFKIDFKYPADLREDEDLSERRPRVLESVFPGKAIDFTNPGT